MGLFLKVFIGFWIIWILWYVTGGPLRDESSKPVIHNDFQSIIPEGQQ
jgi:hypothetical protein